MKNSLSTASICNLFIIAVLGLIFSVNTIAQEDTQVGLQKRATEDVNACIAMTKEKQSQCFENLSRDLYNLQNDNRMIETLIRQRRFMSYYYSETMPSILKNGKMYARYLATGISSATSSATILLTHVNQAKKNEIISALNRLGFDGRKIFIKAQTEGTITLKSNVLFYEAKEMQKKLENAGARVQVFARPRGLKIN